MPILALQRRIREVGRIRLGVQTTTKTGRKAPRKLDKFRLTSADRRIIEAVAEIYGGRCTAWMNGEEEEYECQTDVNELPIVLPPDPNDMGWSQFFESWGRNPNSAGPGLCTRRCDGEHDLVRDAPCDCDPEDRACKITSRLSVLLPEIPGLGVWRLESHGYYAGVELGGAIEIIGSLAGARSMVPARLRLTQREVRRIINGKPEVRQFVVPAIDLDVSVTQVQALNAVTPTAVAIEAPAPRWKGVPAASAPAALSVGDQLAEVDKPHVPTKRANAAAPLPTTGRKPRTAAEREANVIRMCVRCEEPVGTEPVVRNPDGPGYVHKGACPLAALMQTESPVEPHPEPDPPEPDRPEPDPVPAPGPEGRTRMPTAKMHSAIFPLLAECFPIPPGVANAEEMRRQDEMRLCELLGRPGLTSHKQVDFDLATLMIDTLKAIKAGEIVATLDDDEGRLLDLVDPETGEILHLGGEG